MVCGPARIIRIVDEATFAPHDVGGDLLDTLHAVPLL